MKSGDVMTLHGSGAVGTEKAKERPVVVLHDFGSAVLVAPITDAGKTRMPTHHMIQGYNSGSSKKDALVATEHVQSVPASALTPRPNAASLTGEMQSIRYRLRIALALESVRNPPQPPKFQRGSFVNVDHGVQSAPLVTGVTQSVIISNNQGNAFGQHYIVAPVVNGPALRPFALSTQTHVFDLGQMRVVDASRIKGVVGSRLSADEEAALNAELSNLLPA